MATSRQVSAYEVAKMTSDAAALASRTAVLVKLMYKALSSTTKSALAATASTVLDFTPDNANRFAGAPHAFTVAANVINGAAFILSNVASAISKLSATAGDTSDFTSAYLAVAEALKTVSMMGEDVRKATQACCEAMTTVSKGSDRDSSITAVSKATLALEDVASDIPKVILATNQAQSLASILSVKITGHGIPTSGSFITTRGAVTVVGGASESMAIAKRSIGALRECISAAKGSFEAAYRSLEDACGSMPPAISAISNLDKANACLEEIDHLFIAPVVEGSEVHETMGEQRE